SANDGVTNFLPTPTNRWTSYESPEESDWLEIDFGKQVECRRVELAIYDDRGGVQPPDSYTIQVHNGSGWRDVEGMRKTPERPAGSQWNVATFSPVTTAKIRIVFLHHGQSRSGVTEVMVWNEPMPRD
ncbi:MAG: discoidin domain-containing protein, partial [Planctomycetales bacterium]|nr:discoidin domain-containing protein [Planctomycetales bacterium]